MKVKTIEKTIAQVMRNFVASIEDTALRKDVSECLVVTGGCIASMLSHEPVNDYDVYLSSEEVAKRLAEYYVGRSELTADRDVRVVRYGLEEDRAYAKRMGGNLEPGQVKVIIPSAGVVGDPNDSDSEGEEPKLPPEAIEPGTFTPVFISPNAITLSDKVQVITRFTGIASEIHKNFDFLHAFNYWTPKEGLVLRVDALSAIIGKELIYRGSRYPVASVIRSRKFMKRGWTINAGQYLKMMLQLQSLNLLDRDVLEDQLIGVDSTYFAWFLSLLDCAMSKPGAPDKLDATYVIEAIEKVFG